MHYKNGREAKEGDAVVRLDAYNKKTSAGVLHSLNAGASTCNAQIAVPVMGGVRNDYVTIGEVYHAEDAILALEPQALAPTS